MAAEAPKPAQPDVLNYATPGDDGLAEFVPQAEEWIAKRGSVDRIRPFFRHSREALRYFVKSVRRRFSASDPSDVCVQCGAANPAKCVNIKWQVRVTPKALEFAFSDRDFVTTVSTSHAICQTCGEKLVSPWNKWNLLWLTGMCILAVGIYLLFASGSDKLRHLFPQMHRSEVEQVAALSGVIVIVIGALLTTFARFNRLPHRISRAVPRGMKFSQFVGLRERLIIPTGTKPQPDLT